MAGGEPVFWTGDWEQYGDGENFLVWKGLPSPDRAFHRAAFTGGVFVGATISREQNDYPSACAVLRPGATIGAHREVASVLKPNTSPLACCLGRAPQ